MTPERIQDARELLDKLPAEEWVKRYGRDLITAIERQAVSAVARGNLAAVAAGGARLGRDCAEALKEFETSIGGGDRDRGRKLLTDHSGMLKPTQARMAAAVRLYAAIRLYVLRWAAAGQGQERCTHPLFTASEEALATPITTPGQADKPLAKLLALAESIPLPNATPEERERVQEKIREFRKQGEALGLLDPEPDAEEPPAPVDPEAN